VFRTIQWRITLPFVALVVATMLSLGVFLTDSVRSSRLEDLRSELESQARLVAEVSLPAFLASHPPQELALLADRVGGTIDSRITIVAPDGTVLADSQEDPSAMDNHGSRPEVKEAFTSGTGESTRYSATLEQNMMYFAVPIVAEGKVLGVSRVALPVTSVQASVNQVTASVVTATAAACGLVVVAAWFIARRTTGPLRDLTAAAQRISAGELDQKIAVSALDEPARLAHAFNEMSLSLRGMLDTISRDRARLVSMLNSMADGVIMTDAEGNILQANRAAERIFEVKNENAVGKPLIEVARDHEVSEMLEACLQENQEKSTQFEAATSRRFLRAIAVPVGGRDLSGAVVLFQDLTELRGLQTMRRELVGNISHEFRTPLAGIKAMVETLSDGALEDRRAARDFLPRIAAEVDRLTQLVTELTELSRIETGE